MLSHSNNTIKRWERKNLQKHWENKQVNAILQKPSIIHFTKCLLHITIHTWFYIFIETITDDEKHRFRNQQSTRKCHLKYSNVFNNYWIVLSSTWNSLKDWMNFRLQFFYPFTLKHNWAMNKIRRCGPPSFDKLHMLFHAYCL